MRCKQCQHADTKVIESRDAAEGDAVRRRRSCPKCEHRFTTYERVEQPHLVVIKNNGTRELFDRDKLFAGLYRACEKTKVTNVQIEKLVANTEQQLHSCGDPEVSSSKIGEMIMDSLADLDEVAYVRFASVYRRFKDVAGFERELSQIRKRKDGKASA